MDDSRSRFRLEYLGQLILKNGKKECREIKVEEVELVGDNNRKRIDWPLARHVKTIPGRDGIIRVCLIRTKNGELTRTIQKLYPLETEVNRKKFVNKLQKSVKVKHVDVEDLKVKRQNVPTRQKCNKNTIIDNEDEPKIVTTISGRVSKRKAIVDV